MRWQAQARAYAQSIAPTSAGGCVELKLIVCRTRATAAEADETATPTPTEANNNNEYSCAAALVRESARARVCDIEIPGK